MKLSSSARRKQYFQSKTEIFLPNGIRLKIKYVEVYPESIGLNITYLTKDKLVILVAQEIEKLFRGKIIGKKITNNGKFIEEISFKIGDKLINGIAQFELDREDYIYLIRLIYIA